MWGLLEVEQEFAAYGGEWFWWLEDMNRLPTDNSYYKTPNDALKAFYDYIRIVEVIM